MSQSSPDPAAKTETEIGYDASNRATTVTLPASDGSASTPRAKKTYTYGSGTTSVAAAGLSGAGTVTFDGGWKQLVSTSAMGVSSSNEWHPTKDLLLSTTNSLGQKSTTIYDAQTDRATDTYGPAPAACFTTAQIPVANPVGTSGCGLLPAHQSTTYDAGLNGLQATYYTGTPNLAGRPAKFSLGIDGATGGAVDKNWGTTAPATGVSVDNWSLRLTGLITFPQAGTYVLRLTNDDGARLFLGDVLAINPQTQTAEHDTASAPITVATAGETRRIRIDYQDFTGASRLTLTWTTPANATFSTVPGTQLKPDYGLTTSTSADDSAPTGIAGISDALVPDATASFTYEHPWLGQATSTTVDPGGLNLTTTQTYEQPNASGWLRRITRALPAAAQAPTGVTAKTTSSYYGDLEVGPAVCGLSTGVRQFGLTKSMTGATPATGSAVVTENVYDIMGRTIATKTSGDTGWSCTTFDARGRVTQQTAVGPTGTTPKTTTTAYAVGTGGMTMTTTGATVSGSPNGSTITTRTDLLGRVIRYEDVWGTATTPTYESLTGRVLSVTTTPASGAVTNGTADQGPQAVFSAASAGLQLTVNGTASNDVEGPIASYSWMWGDGTPASTGATATHTYSAAGTFNVALTVTDSGGATSTMTRALAVPTTSATIAQDNFARTLSSGWGTANVGGAYTTPWGSSGASVASGTGQLALSAGLSRSMLLNSASAADVRAYTEFSLSAAVATGRTYAGISLRRQSVDAYEALGMMGSDGVPTAVIQTTPSNVLGVASVPGTWAPGQVWAVRTEATGSNPTTVRMKLWNTAGAEPSTWQLVRTDSTSTIQSAGPVALIGRRGSAATASTVLAFDNFLATNVAASATNTAPTPAFTSSLMGLVASVNGGGSTDTEGAVSSYAWSWGGWFCGWIERVDVP